jgi:hypothetical protein
VDQENTMTDPAIQDLIARNERLVNALTVARDQLLELRGYALRRDLDDRLIVRRQRFVHRAEMRRIGKALRGNR